MDFTPISYDKTISPENYILDYTKPMEGYLKNLDDPVFNDYLAKYNIIKGKAKTRLRQFKDVLNNGFLKKQRDSQLKIVDRVVSDIENIVKEQGFTGIKFKDTIELYYETVSDMVSGLIKPIERIN